MIEIQSEFDTSEEMFLGDLIRGIRKGYINFKVEEYTIEDLSDWLNDKGKIMKTIL